MAEITEQIKQHLMTYDVYIKGKTSVPYFFEIEKQGRLLYYFGSNHSFDPDNKQYHLLENYWEEFCRKTKSLNSLVLVEGGIRPVAENAKEAISKGSEANFITYLAAKKNYDRDTADTSRAVETQNLLTKYTKEQIQYYYFARVVYQWGNMLERPNFDEYINSFLYGDEQESGWKDFDFSLENMKKIHKSLFTGNFNEKHFEFFGSIVNPLYNTTVVNSFSQDQGCERDVLIVKKILDSWNEGKNLFIVFGHTHAVMQEPALKKLT